MKLASTIVEIGAQCFVDCSSLKKIYNLGWATSTTIGSEFLSGVNLENNTIGASAAVIDGNALAGCNMPEWNLPHISTGALHDRGCFGAPDGTTFKCGDGKSTNFPQATTAVLYFDDGTRTEVSASGICFCTNDLVTAGIVESSDHTWIREPTRVVLGTSITSIDAGTFQNCVKLSTMIMSSGMSIIDANAFKNCVNLTDIDLTYVTYLGSNAFEGCRKITKVNLQGVSGVTGERVFKDCSRLSKVTFSPNFTEIADGMFQNCTSLGSINLSGMESLGEEAFKGTGLMSVNIPYSIGTIGPSVFENCTSLRTATIPKNGIGIPGQCF